MNFSHAYDILDVNLAELYMVEAVYNSFNEMNNARIAFYFCVNWYANFIWPFLPSSDKSVEQRVSESVREKTVIEIFANVLHFH